jgi:hypothetical protein
MRSRCCGVAYDNDPSDLYTASLSLDFTRQFGAHIIDKKQFAPDPGDESDEFATIAGDVCAPGATSTPVVLYAGRESAFPDFIKGLRTDTNCHPMSTSRLRSSRRARGPRTGRCVRRSTRARGSSLLAGGERGRRDGRLYL